MYAEVRRGRQQLCALRPSHPDRQNVAVNLVLEDDAALGPVVGALGSRGSRILGLQKSEPTLEDVFVELVGRGFADEDESDAPAGSADARSAEEPGEPALQRRPSISSDTPAPGRGNEPTGAPGRS